MVPYLCYCCHCHHYFVVVFFILITFVAEPAVYNFIQTKGGERTKTKWEVSEINISKPDELPEWHLPLWEFIYGFLW